MKNVAVPEYPPLAQHASIEGTVALKIEIGADGHPVDVHATGAHRLLERAAEENVRQWNFCPQSATMNIRFVYKLTEPVHDVGPAKVVIYVPDLIEVTASRFQVMP